MDEPRFTYRSLDTSKNELRLLQVLPEGENEQICCLLTHASLDALNHLTMAFHTPGRS